MPRQTEAARSIALAGEAVPYLLARSRRRSIALTVDHRGLRVGAPRQATLSEIEALLQRHADWVMTKLRLRRQRQSEALNIVDGLRFPWLGGELRVHLPGTPGRNRWSADGGELTLAVPAGRVAREALERVLRTRVRGILAGRLARFAAVLDVPVPPLKLSSARTRWGSCNTRGEIRLNWRLGFFPLPLVDYVVAHELAHLKEMNHSPRFWAVVETLCPDWRARRAELRQRAASLPIFES